MRFPRLAAAIARLRPVERPAPMRVRSADGWRRHFDLAAGTSDFGLSQVGWKDYRVAGPTGALRPASSMLEFGELALLYGLVRDRWTGRGEILDLGPYWGLTTWCLSQGLRDNRPPPPGRAKAVFTATTCSSPTMGPTPTSSPIFWI